MQTIRPMFWIPILVLAVVQGIAEFLPISSSGHTVVGLALFFPKTSGDDLTVNIVLHLGTLAAILVFYWRRIWALLSTDRRVIGLLAVGTLPAVVVVLGLGDSLDALVTKPLLAGCMFPLTGLMLLWSARREPGNLTCRELGYAQALLIGAVQAFAILPGISRSGSTIVAGLGCKLRRDEAATFSFLLAIPAIAGAGLKMGRDLWLDGPGEVPLDVLAVGALVSFVVGLISLWWLVRWLEQGWLHYFAYWVIPLGLAVIVWQLFA